MQKMKLVLGFVIITSTVSSSCYAQWAISYGGSNYDYATSIQETSDGGYVVAGFTNFFGAGFGDFWVLKLDPYGNVAWQKTYGGSDGGDYAASIQETSDGGYVVAGSTYSFGSGFADLWVLKLGYDGSVDWQKTYGGKRSDAATSIQETSDGGYIIAGRTCSFGEGFADLWMLKLDFDGRVVWQKTYGGSSADVATSIQETSDGGYIVAGGTYSFGAGDADLWVLKLDSGGNVAWQKTYGGSRYDYASSIQETSDGGYVVTGSTGSFSTDGYDFWVLRLDPYGDVTWQKTYGGSNYEGASSIKETSDGGYVVAGYTWSFDADDNDQDVLVLKLSNDGEIPRSDIIENSNAVVLDTSAAIGDTFASPLGSAAVVVDTDAMPQDTWAEISWIYPLAQNKWDLRLEVQRHHKVVSSTDLYQNYPNPFNPDTWIPYQLKEDANILIRIYSAAGQLVRTLNLGPKPAGFHTSRDKAAYWDGNNEAGKQVASGIYFYDFSAGSFRSLKRMMILR